MGLGEGLVRGRLVAHLVVVTVVAWALRADVRGRSVAHLAQAGGRRQGLVVDLHKLGAVPGDRLGLGHHQGDRIAHIAHEFAAEQGMGRLKHGTAVPILHRAQARQQAEAVGGNLPAGEDRQHARQGAGGRGVQGQDAPVGVGRAQRHGTGLPRKAVVVGEAALAGQEPFVFPARDRCAHAALFHCHEACVPNRRFGELCHMEAAAEGA
jgi:hypothetical protein